MRLYDRQGYLEEVEALFSLTRRGTTNCLVVEGAWGTGKTALLGAAGDIASRAGVLPIKARGRDLDRRLRYAVLFDVLEGITAAWASDKVPAIAALRELVDDLHDQDLTSGGVHHRLSSVIAAAGEDQRLVFIVDDADQADNDSMVALNALTRRLGPHRAWLVASTSPRQPGMPLRAVDWLVAEPYTRLLSIGPLPLGIVEQAIEDFAGIASPPPLTTRFYEVTGGRPLLLFALLSALGREELLTATTDWVGRLDTVVVPGVARAVLARLSKMSIAASDLLQAAAVLGNEALFADARQLARIDAAAAERGADAAVQAELLNPWRPLSFTSPLIRSAIYNDIPPSRRARLHADAARLLTKRGGLGIEIRAHLLLTEPAHDEAMVERLHQSGRSALGDGDVSTAARCFERALAEPPTPEQRSALLLDLAVAEAALQMPEASDHLRQAVNSGNADAESLAQTAVRLLRSGLPPEVFDSEILSPLLDVAVELSSSRPALSLELQLALSILGRQPAEVVMEDVERLLESPGVHFSPIGRLASAYVVTSTLGKSGRWRCQEAVDVLESTLDFDELFGSDVLASTIQFSSAVLLLRCGRFDTIDTALRSQGGWASLPGEERSVATKALLTGLSALWQSQLAVAVDCARDALVASMPTDGPTAQLSRACLAHALLEQGDCKQAREVADEFGSNPSTDLLTYLWMAEIEARVRVAEGNVALGLEALLAVGRVADAAAIDNPALTGWRQEASRAATELRQLDQAETLAAEAVERARAFGDVRSLGDALCAAAEAASASSTRVKFATEAVSVLDGSSAIGTLARALVELGIALGVVDRRAEARDVLRRAAHLASLTGADPLVEYASVQLRMAGARPRRVAMTGWEALTPAEARVAAMAASGETNAGIAGILVVTLKTVEGHLARTYNKLGIRSRKELANLHRAHTESDLRPALAAVQGLRPDADSGLGVIDRLAAGRDDTF